MGWYSSKIWKSINSKNKHEFKQSNNNNTKSQVNSIMFDLLISKHIFTELIKVYLKYLLNQLPHFLNKILTEAHKTGLNRIRKYKWKRNKYIIHYRCPLTSLSYFLGFQLFISNSFLSSAQSPVFPFFRVHVYWWPIRDTNNR